MLTYALRRLLVLPLLMALVTIILFAVILQLPAELRVQVYLPSVNPHLTPEQVQELIATQIARRGLDDPPQVQYLRWMGGLLSGDWGYSPTWRQPVLDGLRQHVPPTVELALFAIVPAVALALALGGLAARHESRLPDYLIRAAAFAGWALPSFILGLILINVFYVWLDWFPLGRLSVASSAIVNSDAFTSFTGMLTLDSLLNGEIDMFLDALKHLVLPAVTLAVMEWALLVRVSRSSLLEVLGRGYITTARSKGLREQAIMSDHAGRNAILPVISTAGVVTSMLLSGVVVVEVLFNWNGVGTWATEAILRSDVPVAVGFAIFSCAVVLVASLAADILYAVFDPRIRLF